MPELSPLEEVRRFFRDNPQDPGRPLVVAVSGGPDSVCLLHCFCELLAELSLQLHVAHLDHRLRGADSEADAAYVEQLSRELGIPATIEARDVDTYRREHKLSLEEAAREVRYTFFEDIAARTGAGAVAVGHTADDRAETVLMNLLRGAGTRGLRGLLPVTRRGYGEGLTVLRPLLNISHETIVTYCRENELHPRLDASNLSMDYLRNRVRHSLIPVLREYNPRIVDALLRTAFITADDASFIESEIETRKESVLKIDGESITIDKTMFQSLHPALQRGILRAAVLSIRGSLKDLEAGHIEDLLAGAAKQAGTTIELPEDLSLIVEYDRFILTSDKDNVCPLPVLEGEVPLDVPGTTEFPGWTVTAEVFDRVPDSVHAVDAYETFFDYDVTGADLKIRARKPGDRFIPLGMEDKKKLNVFMIDEKVPRSWRQRVPLVTNGSNILWVVGMRIDNRARVTQTTGRVLRLMFRRAA